MQNETKKVGGSGGPWALRSLPISKSGSSRVSSR